MTALVEHPTLPCAECGLMFPTIGHLNKHRRQHHDLPPVKSSEVPVTDADDLPGGVQCNGDFVETEKVCVRTTAIQAVHWGYTLSTGFAVTLAVPGGEVILARDLVDEEAHVLYEAVRAVL